MSCPSLQWHRSGDSWSPIRTLPVPPLLCGLGQLFPNSHGNKAAGKLRLTLCEKPAQTPRLGGCSAVASMSVTAGPGRPRAALVCQVTAVTQTVKARFPSHSQAHCSHQGIRNQASTTPDSDSDVPVHLVSSSCRCDRDGDVDGQGQSVFKPRDLSSFGSWFRRRPGRAEFMFNLKDAAFSNQPEPRPWPTNRDSASDSDPGPVLVEPASCQIQATSFKIQNRYKNIINSTILIFEFLGSKTK